MVRYLQREQPTIQEEDERGDGQDRIINIPLPLVTREDLTPAEEEVNVEDGEEEEVIQAKAISCLMLN